MKKYKVFFVIVLFFGLNFSGCNLLKRQQPDIINTETTKKTNSSKETVISDTLGEEKETEISFLIDCNEFYEPIINDLYEKNNGLKTELEQRGDSVIIYKVKSNTRYRTKEVVITDTFFISQPNPVNIEYQKQNIEMRSDLHKLTEKNKSLKKWLIVTSSISVILIIIIALIFKVS